MGVSQAPFLYDPPSHYSFDAASNRSFNPRTASQASFAPSVQKKVQDGPLINFNRHPDSVSFPSVATMTVLANTSQYLIVDYSQKDVKPMSPKTKPRIKRLRGVQLALRLLELIGTLGMLFAVITIKNTSSSVAWILRVAVSGIG